MKPHQFDKMILSPPKPGTIASESLWGWTTIARHLGLSVEFTKRLAAENDSPIRVIAGRPFTTKAALASWLLPRSAVI